MSFGIIFLIWKLILMATKAYLFMDNSFKNHIIESLHIQNILIEKQCQAAQDEYLAYWWKWDVRFRYLQAIGPALGFIMTVTSLVQALYPQVTTAHNLDEFFRGIHVALISTFLGLLLRVIALEGARVNDILLRRADLILSELITFAHSYHNPSAPVEGDSSQ
jgi:biopolymer transport protein ExbB/TolQ